MKPAPFSLHRAKTVADAIRLLGSFDDDAEVKLIAGGQSLVPLLNFRLARPDHLIDIYPIEELRTIDCADDRVRIGAMVNQQRIVDDPAIQARLPLLSEAVADIGHRHIRNRGTIGGSLAHADPAAELPTVALALDASLTIEGPTDRRTVAAADFFDGWFSTVLADDELLVAVEASAMEPREPGGSVEWGFRELTRRQGDFALVLVATVIWRDPTGVITDARIVAGGVGSVPVRCGGAEQALIGTLGGAVAVAEASLAALDGLEPVDDVHGSADYRLEMVEVLVKRCLTTPNKQATTEPDSAVTPSVNEERSTSSASFTSVDSVEVNGETRDLGDVADRRLLADWLRDDLGLTGTHLGCEHGVCGACTVLLDDEPVRSCLTLARQSAGRSVTTIEHIGTPVELHPVQESFRTHHGLQCGFCTPGMVLTTLDLLTRIPDPTEEQVREELSGNICRCTGYVKIVEAVMAAADKEPADGSS